MVSVAEKIGCSAPRLNEWVKKAGLKPGSGSNRRLRTGYRSRISPIWQHKTTSSTSYSPDFSSLAGQMWSFAILNAWPDPGPNHPVAVSGIAMIVAEPDR